MTDRDLQDEVIRALADAGYRASPGWTARGLAPPDRVERFARFLARHFYRLRVQHFFKYSRALARVTGRRPEEAVDGPGFDALLPRMRMGSRETAAEVAALAAALVRSAPVGPPYLEDLLAYESAMMVAEAGPRVWGEAPEGDVPELSEGTVVLALGHDLPAVLPALLGAWEEPPEAPERPVRLLVARSPHGRVTVARVTDEVATLIERAAAGTPLPEAAAAAGVDPERAISDLVDLGAVRMSSGS